MRYTVSLQGLDLAERQMSLRSMPVLRQLVSMFGGLLQDHRHRPPRQPFLANPQRFRLNDGHLASVAGVEVRGGV